MGGLNFRWLVNAFLLVLPVAVTVGVLLGIQSHRDATGQPPLFKPDPSPTPPKDDNGLTKEQYCQKSYGIEVETKGQEYTLNPNQWGWDEGDEGHLCLNVTTFNNHTYATDFTAPAFSVTWEYPPGPETAPVHAFPNIKVDGGVFPTTLKTITAMNIDLEWSYSIGNKSAKTTDLDALTEHSVNTNIAVDMFVDSDKTQSEDSAKATYEIMVWYAMIGPATQPLGYSDAIVATKAVDGVTFELYYGENTATKQKVFTWLAKEVTESFSGDIAPLLEAVLTSDNKNAPSSSDYLGYFALGSEALSADTNVTLSVPTLSIDIKTSTSAS